MKKEVIECMRDVRNGAWKRLRMKRGGGEAGRQERQEGGGAGGGAGRVYNKILQWVDEWARPSSEHLDDIRRKERAGRVEGRGRGWREVDG